LQLEHSSLEMSSCSILSKNVEIKIVDVVTIIVPAIHLHGNTNTCFLIKQRKFPHSWRKDIGSSFRYCQAYVCRDWNVISGSWKT